MKKIASILFCVVAFIVSPSAYSQLGKIIKHGNDLVLNPNLDEYITQSGLPFSSHDYNVPEFEIKMFGIPIVGGGTGVNVGQRCGIDDFIPDTRGYSSYAVRLADTDNNLIFRFRVEDNTNKVQAWSILLDTDGLFGIGVNPNATADNPGFEIEITLIKNVNQGVYVYNIDGVDKCPTPLLSYPLDSHFQIAIADEQPCGDLTFFYDYYVPFREISNALGIDVNTGLRFAAVTNVSATCAIGGKISDVSGLNDLDYNGCFPCMFNALINAQCPTAIVDLCETCPGFQKDKVDPPTINQPIVAGQRIVDGTTVESDIFVLVQVFTNLGTASAPRWDTLSPPRMEKGVYASGTIWTDTIPEPLLDYDKVRATSKKKENSGGCGGGGGNQASSTAISNPAPFPVAQNQNVAVDEDTRVDIALGPPNPDNFILDYSIITNPTHGTLGSVNTITHEVTYVPTFNYYGPDSFTFKLTNGTTYQSTGTINITVNHVNHAPVANSQGGLITPEDTPKNITLTATDVDAGDVLTYFIVNVPSHGTVNLTGTAVTYTPAADYFGQDSFTFKANDGTVDSNIATISITVTSVNDPPVADNQNISVIEDTPTGITLSATDVAGDALTFTVLSSPAHGSLSGTAPNLTYIPALNYNGSDSFTFKANDGIVDSNTGTISITVTPVNDAPVANNQGVTTDEDVAVAITLSGSDVDGNTLTYTVAIAPAHGALSGTAPNLTYTPAANFFSNDHFTFKVNDGTVDSNIATISITVTPVNDAPVANDQNITVIEDSPTGITLSAVDAGEALTYTVLSSPAHGSLSGTAPNLTYIPALNYNGSDSFTFKANDGIVDSNTGAISITVTPVNDAPVADNQGVTTDEDVAVPITLSGSDVDGNSLAYSIVAGPAHGTVNLTGNTLTYTPAPNFFSNDHFTFKVNDGTVDSNIATISITVTPVNDAPVANDQNITVIEDSPTGITLSAVDAGEALTYAVLSSPAHGSLSGTAPNLTYIPALNYNGSDSFTFKANDGSLDSNTGTISITVTPVNDAPLANDQGVTTDEDVAVPITLSGSDVDGNSLAYSIVASPAHGTVNLTGNTVTYTPAPNFFSNDHFTFKVNDGTVDSNIATISITVTPINDAPVANDQNISVTEDSPTEITLSAVDAGEALTYTVLSLPAHGSLSGTAPNLTYIPALNYNGSDSFTFKANDGIVDSNTGAISITVTPVNDAPVADNQGVTTDEDVAVPITLSGSDVDGNSLAYSIVAGPAHGTVNLTGNTVTYTPAPNFFSNDHFTFKVNDGTVDSNIATISITVTPVNDAPVANDQNITVIEDSPTGITLSAVDAGEALTYAVLSSPAHGSLSGTAPNLTYIPALNYNGSDSFTFKANDGSLDSNTGTISITVTPVNDAPLANDQGVTTDEDVAVPITLSGSDVDGNSLTYSIGVSPAHGALSGTAPNLTYTPASNYNGPDQFTFTVNDGTGSGNSLSTAATVSITVTSVNDAPVANDQTVSAPEDSNLGISLTGSDVDGNGLTYTIGTSPLHGTLSGTAPNLTYTPDFEYNGGDDFTFTVNDGTGNGNSTSGAATVSITVIHVNDAPIADNQGVTFIANTPQAITLTGSDLDGDPITFIIVSPPTNGTLTGIAPDVTYKPNNIAVTQDEFTFQVSDGTLLSNIAKVTLNVPLAGNYPPTADDQSVTVTEDVPKQIVLSASDLNGNALTYNVTLPTHGILNGTAPNLTYVPVQNYNGSDSFTFTVDDGSGEPNSASNVATISIDVAPVNDTPIADDLSVTTSEDIAKSITLSGSDVDGNTLTYTVANDPVHGTLSGIAPNFTYAPDANYNGPDNFTFKVNDGTNNSNSLSVEATVTISITPVNDKPVADDQAVVTPEDTDLGITLTGSDVDGDGLTFSIGTAPTHGVLIGTAPNLTYVPELNYNGPDSFTFTVDDGAVNPNSISAQATVSIDVTAVNDTPIADNQVWSTAEDTSLGIILTGSDVDGNTTLTYTVATGPARGTLSGTAPNLTYTPDANYFGPDAFAFTVDDGTGSISAPAIVFITVTPVNDAPVANDQTVSTPEDTDLGITLTGSGVDGNGLTYNVVTSPTHGVLNGTPPSLTYVPTLNYNGPDSFTFTVDDGTGSSNSTSAAATISIGITPVNDTPIADNQVWSTAEDTSLGIILTGSDVDGNSTLTYTIATGPARGTLSGTAPNLTYTPDANYFGPDAFAFTVDDGTGSISAPAIVFITITPVNDPPVANDQTVSTLEDTDLGITLTGSGVDGNGLTYSVVTSPTHGVLVGTAPNLTYVPTLNYNGPDSFTFTVDDGTGSSNSTSAAATISIGITPVNDTPIADNQVWSTAEDTSLGIILTGSDVDGNTTLTYTVASGPARGTLSGTAPNLTYTPDANYFGPDAFAFTVDDGTGSISAPAIVFITITPVNDPPVANDQTVSTPEDTDLGITLTGSGVDGNGLTYSVVTSPTHGVLVGTAPNLTYVPTLNYNGPDSFTFTVDDGTGSSNSTSAAATISIGITPVNDTPIADNQVWSTAEDTSLGIILTGSDVDGNTTLTYTVASGPARGTLSGTAPNLTYTPDANYFGPDAFAFTVDDGTGSISAPAIVFITITPVNDPPVANDQTVSTLEDTDLGITLTGSGVDGNGLTYSVVTSPTHGVLVGTAPNLTYVPTLNYNGPDSFTFTVDDGTGSSNSTSAAATVSIGITPVNDTPIANNQSADSAEDTPVGITLTGSDVDGNTLTYSIVRSPAHGVISGTAPNLTYTPTANYNGTDNLTFTINDGTGSSNSMSTAATVSITITPVNDAPVAVSSTDDVTVVQDSAVPIDLVGSDADGDALTYIIATPPSHGTLNGTAPNVIYIPALNYSGPDGFTFKVNDGSVDSNIASVSITVLPLNNPPIADDQSVTTKQNLPLAITLTSSDIDGDLRAYFIVVNPDHGSLTGTAPNLTYTPGILYNGSDSFTFKANDGLVDSNIATVSITITPVNHPPVISFIPDLNMKEDTLRLICLNVIDVDGDPITYGQPANAKGGGTMTKTSAPFDFCYTFTPSLNYNGESIWDMNVCDTGGLCGSRSVKIIITPVNDPPYAVNDEVEVNSRQATLFNVMANDFVIAPPYQEFYDIFSNDPNYSDALTMTTTPLSGPLNGTVQMSADGTVSYTPKFDFAGSDSIKYQICDHGNLCATAVAFIKVGLPPFKIYEGVSPNGDNVNDYWRIDGIELFPNNMVRVFDRFDNLVFETSAYSNEKNNWQGQANHGLTHDALPEGTYFYRVDLGNGEHALSGYVELKRH